MALRDGREIARLSLRIPGHHNVMNSLAALVACIELGIEAKEAANRLGEYLGAGRRFEVKGTAYGVTVVDDYAHHPTEIAANIEAARSRYPGRRMVVLFQPHTYTRTRDFLGGFASVLGKADWLWSQRYTLQGARYAWNERAADRRKDNGSARRVCLYIERGFGDAAGRLAARRCAADYGRGRCVEGRRNHTGGPARARRKRKLAYTANDDCSQETYP